jgi:hypothetical protein
MSLGAPSIAISRVIVTTTTGRDTDIDDCGTEAAALYHPNGNGN